VIQLYGVYLVGLADGFALGQTGKGDADYRKAEECREQIRQRKGFPPSAHTIREGHRDEDRNAADDARWKDPG